MKIEIKFVLDVKENITSDEISEIRVNIKDTLFPKNYILNEPPIHIKILQ
jgi:hypothetical protein